MRAKLQSKKNYLCSSLKVGKSTVTIRKDS